LPVTATTLSPQIELSSPGVQLIDLAAPLPVSLKDYKEKESLVLLKPPTAIRYIL